MLFEYPRRVLALNRSIDPILGGRSLLFLFFLLLLFSSMTDLGTTTNDQTEKDWTTNIPVLPLIFESVTCKIPKSLAVSFMTCPLCEQRLKKVTTITSCLHRFCEHCIKIYLQRVHMNCPICGIRLTSLRQLRTDVEYGRLVQELDKVFS